MKAQLLTRAAALGFDACRVTDARAPDHAPQFQRWLAAGRHASMLYLARNAARRLDPRQVLPGARSIIALAVSYHSVQPAASGPALPLPATDPDRNRSGNACGIVARYARFRDYHPLLRDLLTQLAAFLQELGGPGVASRIYVDTGPLLERDLAERAGLGFVGKHTNLIHRQLGNWFFLAEIVTTLALEPDPPQHPRCGSCTRCLAACPTQALVAPFELDARRCLAYLTIEHKGPIPLELRPALGTRIFGCDDCLAVCPWNRFARAGRWMAVHRRADLDAPGLVSLLSLSDAGFEQQFGQTPLARTRRRGLLRNVCVALGNTADRAALGPLERAAVDPDPLIAEHAQWAIGRIQSAPP